MLYAPALRHVMVGLPQNENNLINRLVTVPIGTSIGQETNNVHVNFQNAQSPNNTVDDQLASINEMTNQVSKFVEGIRA